MNLQKFLKDNNIRTSDYGNICINDLVDYLILSENINNVKKKFSNDYKIEYDYYLSPKYCYNIFKNNKKPKKLVMFLNLLSSDLNIDLKMSSIYLISTHQKAKINEFKLGKFSGSVKKLISRYTTSLVSPIVFYYRKVNNYTLIEKQILSDLDKFRIINANGNKSEWIALDKNKIINTINKNIRNFDQEHDIEIFDNKLFLTFKKLLLHDHHLTSSTILNNNIICDKKFIINNSLELNYNDPNILYYFNDIIRYIYYQFSLDYDLMTTKYVNIKVPMNYDFINDADNIHSFIHFSSHYIKDSDYYYIFDNNFKSFNYDYPSLISELHNFLCCNQPLDLSFSSLVSLSLTNHHDINHDARGVRALDWKLYFWPSFTVSNNNFITLHDLIIACYKIKSHKFENYYELFTEAKKFTFMTSLSYLYPLTNYHIFLSIGFDHGS